MINLVIPNDVVIDFDLIPPPPVTVRESQLRMQEAIDEVGAAIRRWEWENVMETAED